MPRPTGFTQSDRSRVEGDKGAENIGPRTYVLDASVDPTDARKATVRRFGRSDRSRLIPRHEITPDERGVMVRDAAQFGTGIGPGPEYGFWARPKVGPTEPPPLSGGTWQAVKSSCVPNGTKIPQITAGQ